LEGKMGRKSFYKSSKMPGAFYRQYPKDRTYSRPHGNACRGGDDLGDRRPRFFGRDSPKNRLLIDFAKLPILIRLGCPGHGFCRYVWAGILMRLPSRAVEEIRVTAEVPGPRLLQTLLEKAAEGVEIPHRGNEPTPQHIIADNGREVRSRTFHELVEKSGLKLSHVSPHRLRSSVATERFFSALNQQLLKTLPGYDGGKKRVESATGDESARFLTLPQLQTAVDEWVAAYNQRGR
jgi:transposase InsO family protein